MKPQTARPRGPGTRFLDQSLMSASLVVICYLLKRESGARTAARPLGSTCACPSSKLISKAKAEAVFPQVIFSLQKVIIFPGVLSDSWLVSTIQNIIISDHTILHMRSHLQFMVSLHTPLIPLSQLQPLLYTLTLEVCKLVGKTYLDLCISVISDTVFFGFTRKS